MRAYLQLLRLPAVFTAMADIFLGFELTQGAFGDWPPFVGLLIASCTLYLSGMVFNDVFDVAQDTAERPERPIPSGRVSQRSATLLGTGLMLLGVVAAWCVAPMSGCISILLAIAILGYDRILKRTPVGPIGMGLCRFLNLMLGASYVPWDAAAALWGPPQLIVALGLGVYITGVTWFARTEAKTSSASSLLVGLIVMDTGVAMLIWLFNNAPHRGKIELAFILLGLIVVSLNMRALRAIGNPSPPVVQGLVKLFLLNYVTISAAVMYWHSGSGVLAFATACLVLPAMFLSRLIAIT